MRYTFRLDFLNKENALESKKWEMDLEDFEYVETTAAARMTRKDAIMMTVRDDKGCVVFRLSKFSISTN